MADGGGRWRTVADGGGRWRTVVVGANTSCVGAQISNIVMFNPFLAVVCVKGEYSKSGYAPCKKCPQHFYQDRTKSKSCLEADVGQGTTTAGADSSALNGENGSLK